VADGTENDVGSVAVAAFEMAAAEMAICLHVSDHGFDRRAAVQWSTNWPPGAQALVVTIEALTPNS
jgi:hypothetical protein